MRGSGSCSSSAPPPASARLLQGRRVDAIALAGGRRAVLEDVAEMSAAAPAMHLDALHSVTAVALQTHRARIGGPCEARPAGAALELLLRPEQLGAAAGAEEPSGLVVVVESARERPLGALLPQHAVLLRRQLAAPLLVGLPDLVAHGDRIVPPSSRSRRSRNSRSVSFCASSWARR